MVQNLRQETINSTILRRKAYFLLSDVKWHNFEGANASNNPYILDYKSGIGDGATNREKDARNKKLRNEGTIEVNEFNDSDEDVVVKSNIA